MHTSIKLLAAALTVTLLPVVDAIAGGPSIAFDVSELRYHLAPAVPSTRQVCVYTGPNYTGATQCYPAGSTVNTLAAAWDNRIMSMRIRGGGRVLLCRDRFLTGPCSAFTSSRPMLPTPLVRTISSLRFN